MGAKKTTDFLEKATWTLAVALIVLSLASNFAIPRQNTENPAEIKAQEQIDDAVIPNLPAPSSAE
jgi:preprotein translocase subunit SecG